MTAVVPLTPEIVTGPLAVSGKSDNVFVPPSSFVMVFTSVNVGPMSSLVIVQVVPVPLRPSVTLDPLRVPFPVHDQLLAV